MLKNQFYIIKNHNIFSYDNLEFLIYKLSKI